MIYPKDYVCLPQNLVPAVSASVPLTEIQITDADLLKTEDEIELRTPDQKPRTWKKHKIQVSRRFFPM